MQSLLKKDDVAKNENPFKPPDRTIEMHRYIPRIQFFKKKKTFSWHSMRLLLRFSRIRFYSRLDQNCRLNFRCVHAFEISAVAPAVKQSEEKKTEWRLERNTTAIAITKSTCLRAIFTASKHFFTSLSFKPQNFWAASSISKAENIAHLFCFLSFANT